MQLYRKKGEWRKRNCFRCHASVCKWHQYSITKESNCIPLPQMKWIPTSGRSGSWQESHHPAFVSLRLELAFETSKGHWHSKAEIVTNLSAVHSPKSCLGWEDIQTYLVKHGEVTITWCSKNKPHSLLSFGIGQKGAKPLLQYCWSLCFPGTGRKEKKCICFYLNGCWDAHLKQSCPFCFKERLPASALSTGQVAFP